MEVFPSFPQVANKRRGRGRSRATCFSCLSDMIQESIPSNRPQTPSRAGEPQSSVLAQNHKHVWFGQHSGCRRGSGTRGFRRMAPGTSGQSQLAQRGFVLRTAICGSRRRPPSSSGSEPRSGAGRAHPTVAGVRRDSGQLWVIGGFSLVGWGEFGRSDNRCARARISLEFSSIVSAFVLD